MNIVFKSNCNLKKRPTYTANLANTEKARVIQNRRMPNCTLLESKGEYDLFRTPIGDWWIDRTNWCEEYIKENLMCSEADGFRYLEDYPYFHMECEGVRDRRICQIQSVATAVVYHGLRGIKTFEEYQKAVLAHGHGAYRSFHRSAMADLGILASFTHTLGPDEIKDQINDGKPVIAGLFSRGYYLNPRDNLFFIAIYGYSDTEWLVNDPIGRLRYDCGGWEDCSYGAGRGVRYDMEKIERRLFKGGDASAMGWVNFKEV